VPQVESAEGAGHSLVQGAAPACPGEGQEHRRDWEEGEGEQEEEERAH